MKCFFVFVLTLTSLFQTVRSLGLTVQPETLVGTPTLVVWTRDATDVPPVEFDLRFVQAGADVGLAQANLGMNVNDQFGNVLVTFPSPGQYAIAAVTGNPPNTLIGMSNTITAIASVAPSSALTSVAPPTPVPTISSSFAAPSTSVAPTSTPSSSVPMSSSSSISSAASSSSLSSSASTSLSASTSSAATHSASASTSPSSSADSHPISAVKKHANVKAIVGGIFGSLAFIALLIALFLFFRHRRRERERRQLEQRISFHKDLMVQRRDRDLPSIPTSTASSVRNLDFPLPPQTKAPKSVPPRIEVDVEQGFSLPPSSPSVSTRGSKERASGPSGPIPPSPIGGHLSPHPTRLGAGHIVPSPKGPRPSLKIKKTEQKMVTVTPPLRSAPVIATAPSTTTKPVSAAAAASVSTRTAKRTRRQKQITNRISMLSKQMAEVKATFDAEEDEGKRAEHKRILEEMQREMVWLRDQEEGAWALGLTDVSPPGWARYMTP